MDIEINVWWVLIAVALFAAGWFAARVDIKLLVKESRAMPAWYFRGLNHLMNNEPKQAIDSFVEVVKERPDTLDLQFALGQLFRKQGEIDKATQLHRALLDRPHLSEEHRQRATYALAQDYNAAGLLDRAETHFKSLNGTPHETESLKFLVRIYEMERDWDSAITTTRSLAALSKTPLARELAQYHCELANRALLAGDFATARAQVANALGENKRCTRAQIILGDVEKAQGNVEAAIVAWSAIEQQDSAALGLASKRLADAFIETKAFDRGQRLFAHYHGIAPSQDVLVAAIALHRAAQGDAQAADFVREQLNKAPTLSGLQQLLALDRGQKGPDAALIQSVLQSTTQSAGTYPCKTCGFRAKTYYWQCPGCLNWEHFQPKRQEALDVR
jgi:lipopolysaccharide assembly protein B